MTNSQRTSISSHQRPVTTEHNKSSELYNQCWPKWNGLLDSSPYIIDSKLHSPVYPPSVHPIMSVGRVLSPAIICCQHQSLQSLGYSHMLGWHQYSPGYTYGNCVTSSLSKVLNCVSRASTDTISLLGGGIYDFHSICPTGPIQS